MVHDDRETNVELINKSVTLGLLPLRDVVLFPHVVMPLFVGRRRSIRALEAAVDDKQPLFLVAQNAHDVNHPKQKDLHTVGTVARVLQVLRIQDGAVKVLVEGLYRARLVSMKSSPHYQAVVEPLEEPEAQTSESDALLRVLNHHLDAFVQANDHFSSDVRRTLERLNDAGRLADTTMTHLPVDLSVKQAVLETLDLEERVAKVVASLEQEVEWLAVEQKIQDQVKTQIAKDQRDYFKREKLRAIQKTLAEEEGTDYSDLQALETTLKGLGLAPDVEKKVMGEFEKLKMMPPMSAESTVVRAYLDWVADLPWKKTSKLNRNLKRASQTLHAAHYGLDDVKERVLESLAVQMRVKDMRGPILCLVGPPGVGKTSLGQSIAKAMGREFVRISLGGVRDESEIRGHRRTYIGSMPGRILKAMQRAGVMNPLILLDEVDKMGMDFRGDPASALLEVLDPEQNSSFSDHYLEVPYDLSKVLFMTTANSLDLPDALRDRLEIIQLAGYTEHEKIHIAERHVFPRAKKATGIPVSSLKLSRNALLDVIRSYTREAGVRELERQLHRLCRKVVRRSLNEDSSKKKARPLSQLSVGHVRQFLGVPRYDADILADGPRVGVVNGLAWTSVGGVLLMVEALVLPGDGKVLFTGRLGDVMQESMKAAMSYIKRMAYDLGVAPDFFKKHDIHVHAPEGATPKDGPSAGITISTALLSVVTQIPVRHDVAMTGEITLRGDVLVIGGLKDKLLAALRAGMQTVLIPEGNAKDLAELPPEIKRSLTVHTVKTLDDVLVHALDAPLEPQHIHPPCLVGWEQQPAGKA